jgi:hypothetical protein
MTITIEELPAGKYYRNLIMVTPQVVMVEVAYAQKLTAKSVWNVSLLHHDRGVFTQIGYTRNTRKWGTAGISATYNGFPDQVDYYYAELFAKNMGQLVRFLTGLAKEFYP